MARQEPEASGLNREAVVQAALAMLDTVGVDGLSMRALADRLEVKAASLYWHLRDKGQLLELVAEAVLDRVTVPISPPSWRAQVTAACDELAQFLGEHRPAATVVLSCLPVVQRSRLGRDLSRILAAEGLQAPESAAFALVVEAAASAFLIPHPTVRRRGGDVMTLAVNSGSWRVMVRAAAPGATDLATSVGGGGAASVEVRPDNLVLVKNRRGGNHGAVELNPAYTWYFKIHGGTWNTVLDLSGLSISGIELDSGAGNVTCTLPAPSGVVPIRINSGIVGVTMHRPRTAAVHAVVSSGSVRVRLDDKPIRTVSSDVHWDTPGAPQSADRYDLTIFSGCVRVTMDADAPAAPESVQRAQHEDGDMPVRRGGEGVSLILDGIEKRLGAFRPG